MNLLCSRGRYAGTLNTPLGAYAVAAGSFDRGRLQLHLARAGAAGVTVDAVQVGSELVGTFTSGDDRGPLRLRRTGDAAPLTADQARLPLTPRQWREDLAYLVRELPKRHPDPFAHTSKDRFDAAAAELEHRIDHLDSDAVYIGLDHLANLIGDAHTFVEFPEDDANLPLDIRQFGSDTRVVAVGPGYERALGASVIAIGDTPLAEARRLAAAITPVAETDSLRQSRIDGFLTTGMALHGLGITANRHSARYTLLTEEGTQETVDFRALGPGEEPKWVSAARLVPLSRQPVKGSAACTYLHAARTVYCNVRRIRDLAGPGKEMFDLLGREHPRKLVIDLRHNGGGDYNEGLKYIIEPLRKEADINQKDRLFVLVGADTFSAAMSNAAQFRAMTRATLVGQPIGERPNGYQEPRQFTLPNSHLVVRYSTRYYRFTEGRDNVIVPDKQIATTWEDYRDGGDPVLDWVLALNP